MDDKQLISLVQKYEFLYNKKLADFRNPEKKRQVWRVISKKLNVPVDACVTRYTTLRDRYVRKSREYSKYGRGNDEASDWHMYDSMTFLEPHIRPRNRKGSSIADFKLFENESYDDFTTFSPKPSKTEISRSPSPQFENPLSSTEFCEALSSAPINEHMTSEAEELPSSTVIKAFTDAINSFKFMCQTQMPVGNVALASFGRMITATISEMSQQKQAVAMREVTNLVMALKNEPDENFI